MAQQPVAPAACHIGQELSHAGVEALLERHQGPQPPVELEGVDLVQAFEE